MSRILIQGGRVIDPANQTNAILNVYLHAGKICAVGDTAPDGFSADEIINAKGLIVMPGMIALSARLHEPGKEYKATIKSETRAAAAGGITSLCCTPDTHPVIDETATVELIHRRAEDAGFARVLPIGALTRGLKSDCLSEMATLQAAGCIAFSNAGRAIKDTQILRRAMQYATTFDITLILQAEDPWLAQGSCAHEGAVATRLGLNASPVAAETVELARLLALVEQTGARCHFSHLSSRRAVEMIAAAKQQGLPISADVAIHQLFFTEMDLDGFNSQCHVKPPFRSQRDKEALRRGVQDGTIDLICCDHQPHEADAKLQPFPQTEAGISGLETLLPLTMKLVEEKVLTLSQAVALVTHNVAKVIQQPLGSLTPGHSADLCLFDPNAYWELEPQQLLSQGKNTPFAGWCFQAEVQQVFLAGEKVFSHSL
ncbi:MAG: dihydroorotase [Gammaproteobacteria bacterium]|nr:dihydroorotase [Gammaproteobacteria bacterium]